MTAAAEAEALIDVDEAETTGQSPCRFDHSATMRQAAEWTIASGGTTRDPKNYNQPFRPTHGSKHISHCEMGSLQ